MKKLLNLLNEHAHTYAEHYDDTGEEITITFTGHYDQCFHYTVDDKEGIQTLVDDVVISKRFGFIKYLVENNRIDIERLHKIVDYRLEIKENYLNAHDYNSNCLLMLLSISNTPIEDLISYLK